MKEILVIVFCCLAFGGGYRAIEPAAEPGYAEEPVLMNPSTNPSGEAGGDFPESDVTEEELQKQYELEYERQQAFSNYLKEQLPPEAYSYFDGRGLIYEIGVTDEVILDEVISRYEGETYPIERIPAKYSRKQQEDLVQAIKDAGLDKKQTVDPKSGEEIPYILHIGISTVRFDQVYICLSREFPELTEFLKDYPEDLVWATTEAVNPTT